MTRLFVDAHEVPFPPPGFATIEEVVRHVENNHLAADCAIRQINVDGTPLVLEDLVRGNKRGGEWIRSLDRIQIITGTIWEITAQSAREAALYLAQIEPAISRLAASLEGSPGLEETASLRELLEGLFWLDLLLDRMQSAFPANSAGRPAQSPEFYERHRKLSSLVGKLINLLERADHSGIASLLQSELLPSVPGWKSLFDDIAVRVARPQ